MRDLRLQMAELHKALMLFVQTAQLDDSIAMEVAGLYPTWEELVQKKKTVKAKTVFRYGVNSVGDPQLYSFVSDYIPSEIYTPPEDITHYKAVGLGADGKAIWTQPYGATDAYQAGDEVWHNG